MVIENWPLSFAVIQRTGTERENNNGNTNNAISSTDILLTIYGRIVELQNTEERKRAKNIINMANVEIFFVESMLLVKHSSTKYISDETFEYNVKYHLNEEITKIFKVTCGMLTGPPRIQSDFITNQHACKLKANNQKHHFLLQISTRLSQLVTTENYTSNPHCR